MLARHSKTSKRRVMAARVESYHRGYLLGLRTGTRKAKVIKPIKQVCKRSIVKACAKRCMVEKVGAYQKGYQHGAQCGAARERAQEARTREEKARAAKKASSRRSRARSAALKEAAEAAMIARKKRRKTWVQRLTQAKHLAYRDGVRDGAKKTRAKHAAATKKARLTGLDLTKHGMHFPALGRFGFRISGKKSVAAAVSQMRRSCSGMTLVTSGPSASSPLPSAKDLKSTNPAQVLSGRLCGTPTPARQRLQTMGSQLAQGMEGLQAAGFSKAASDSYVVKKARNANRVSFKTPQYSLVKDVSACTPHGETGSSLSMCEEAWLAMERAVKC